MADYIKRSSNGVIMETSIDKAPIGNEVEFSTSCYTEGPNGETTDVTLLTISKSEYSAGVSIVMRKTTKSRTATQMLHLGKDEIELLCQYIESVKPELKNYHGTVTPSR